MASWHCLLPRLLVVLLVVLRMDWGRSVHLEEVFSSMEQMRRLQEAGQDVLTLTQTYIDAEYERLDKMQRQLHNIRADLGAGPIDVTHPTDAFHAVFMWSRLLNEAETRINYQDLTSALTQAGVPMIKKSDLTGAADAMVRLQKVYNITIDDLASGIVKGHQGRPLSRAEMAEIGLMNQYARHYKVALEWFERAVFKHNWCKEDSEWLKEMAIAYFLLGRTDKAVATLEIAHHQDPDNKVIQMHLDSYVVQLENNYTVNPGDLPRVFEWRQTHYEALCRGDESHTVVHPGLYCRYRPTRVPYLFFKEEVFHKDPWIALIHDVISDEEITGIKEKAIPKLQRAYVGDPSKSFSSRERIGKLAWLWDSDFDGLAQRITDRVGLITSLSTTFRNILSSSEALQVVNYGIGGQYDPHYDFYENQEYMNNLPAHLFNTGDRLATFMFYLSDVREGGATVFPDIMVRVPAVKNSAAFWYNIQKSGLKDRRTKHAGCPVLIGEKWVANKWIREYDQHFRRPCGLSPDATDEL